MLAQIYYILANTTLNQNIGSTARAIKTMGGKNLRLAAPNCELDENTYAIAKGGADLLDNIKRYETVKSACADINIVIGASARIRQQSVKTLCLYDLSELLTTKFYSDHTLKIAFLFGKESNGLTNEELAFCDYHLYIPTNPEYGSLNLAQAVQLVCYEVYKGFNQQNLSDFTHIKASENKPNNQQLQYFIEKTSEFYANFNFADKNNLVQSLSRIYHKADLTQTELNLLSGMLGMVLAQNTNKK